MSRVTLPVLVGNDLVLPQPSLQVTLPTPAPEAVLEPVIITPEPIPVEPHDFTPPADLAVPHVSILERILDFAHSYSLAVFAMLFLLVGSAGTQVGGQYWTAHVNSQHQAVAAAIPKPVRAIAGLNISVPKDQLDAKLQTITSQPATLTVGDQTEPISPETIKSWLQTVPSADKSHYYIGVKPAAIEKSLSDMANAYVKKPVDQVSVTYGDGSSAVISQGRNGTQLTDPNGLKQQAAGVAKTVMDAKGMQFNTPLGVQAFAALTPANFNKMIEVNVSTKQMYLYENGNLTKTYAISAGAPSTPTPIGKYQIFSKLAVQDMRGDNPDGSKYFQPHVRYINYFLPGGYAVHGNYWRPASVFGAVNTSHGCVSLPDDLAKEVYDWAPMGTTVITHY